MYDETGRSLPLFMYLFLRSFTQRSHFSVPNHEEVNVKRAYIEAKIRTRARQTICLLLQYATGEYVLLFLSTVLWRKMNT